MARYEVAESSLDEYGEELHTETKSYQKRCVTPAVTRAALQPVAFLPVASPHRRHACCHEQGSAEEPRSRHQHPHAGAEHRGPV